MLKKTITFTDFNGNERTEDHYFNLSKSECTKLEMGITGGLTGMMERIIAAQDIPSIIDTFEKLILTAYGQKSPDGREFVKSEAISKSFSQTGAYDKLFLELVSDAKKAADFFNGVIDNDGKTPNVAGNNTPTLAMVPPTT